MGSMGGRLGSPGDPKPTRLKVTPLLPKQQTLRRKGRSFCNLFVFIFVVVIEIIGALPRQVIAEKNREYLMSNLCKTQFMRDLYWKVDGAVITSQNERNLDCAVTFQTFSIVQRFMLKFDRLQLDCNDHLYIYDGAHSVGNFKADLSCRNTMQSVGAIYTHTNFVTLKYVTDAWGTDTNGFRLVITAVKDPRHTCNDFRCSLKDFCIHKNLVCDGINHCEDGSDEAASTACVNTEVFTILGMESTWFAMMIVCFVLTMAGLVTAGVLCFYRQRLTTPRHPHNSHNVHGHPPVSYPLHHMYGLNGASSGMINLKMGPVIGGVEGATTLPRPGNWLHPAGLRHGHSAARVHLYCQEKLETMVLTVTYLLVRKMSGLCRGRPGPKFAG